MKRKFKVFYKKESQCLIKNIESIANLIKVASYGSDLININNCKNRM